MTTTTICGDHRGPLAYELVNQHRLVHLKIADEVLIDGRTGACHGDWREKLGEFAKREGIDKYWYQGAPQNYHHSDLIAYMHNEGILQLKHTGEEDDGSEAL